MDALGETTMRGVECREQGNNWSSWPDTLAMPRDSAALSGAVIRWGHAGHEADGPESRIVAPPAAREGPDGRSLPRGVAGPAAGAGERGVGGALRAFVPGSVRRAAASLSAHAPDRTRHGAAARWRSAGHRGRAADRLEQHRHVRADLPRHHRRESGRIPRAPVPDRAWTQTSSGMLRARRAPARPQERSFGEAPPCGPR